MRTNYQYINLDYINTMTDGDKEMKRTMLGMILEEFETEIPKMKTLLKEKNYSELKDVSHRFKSTLAFVGNDLITDANKEVELITKNKGAIEKLPELLSILEHLQPKIHSELKQAYLALQ